MNIMKKSVLLSYISVASLSSAIITPALPTIKTSWLLNTSSINWLVTLFLLGYMLGQLVYGPIANRFGRLNALRAGFLINVLGIIICLVSSYYQNYSLLLFGRFITAIGAAAGLCCTFILINETLDEHQAKQAMSYAIFSFSIGIGLAIFIGGVTTQYLNWHDIFWILLIHAVLTYLSTYLFEETLTIKKAIHVKAIMQSYAHAFKNIRLIKYALFLGFVSVFSYCYSAAGPMIAKNFLGLNAALYGSWNSVTMVGMLAGSLCAAQLMKRYDTTRLLIFSVFMMLIGFASLIIQLACNAQSVAWFFTTTSYLYFFSSCVFPCASYFASNAISDKANASGSMNFINMSSAMLCVAIMGYLPMSAFSAFISTCVGFLAFCLVISLLTNKKRVQQGVLTTK